ARRAAARPRARHRRRPGRCPGPPGPGGAGPPARRQLLAGALSARDGAAAARAHAGRGRRRPLTGGRPATAAPATSRGSSAPAPPSPGLLLGPHVARAVLLGRLVLGRHVAVLGLAAGG